MLSRLPVQQEYNQLSRVPWVCSLTKLVQIDACINQTAVICQPSTLWELDCNCLQKGLPHIRWPVQSLCDQKRSWVCTFNNPNLQLVACVKIQYSQQRQGGSCHSCDWASWEVKGVFSVGWFLGWADLMCGHLANTYEISPLVHYIHNILIHLLNFQYCVTRIRLEKGVKSKRHQPTMWVCKGAAAATNWPLTLKASPTISHLQLQIIRVVCTFSFSFDDNLL